MRIPTPPLALLALALAAAPAAGQAFLPGDLQPAYSAGSQERPAIAPGAGGYLVVWQDDRSSLGGFVKPPEGLHANRDVYAARLDSAGNRIDAVPIVVDQSPFDQLRPRVAWNGSNWLVVWRSSRTTQHYVTDGIYAARVSPGGAVLDVPPILIDDSDDFDERDPLVLSDGTYWFVLYNDFVTGQPSETLDAARVHPAGFVMQKTTLIGAAQGQAAVNVDAEWGGDRFLVAYEKGYNGAYARLFSGSFTPIGGEQMLSATAKFPEVTTNGSSFFVSFSGGRGTPVSASGVVSLPGGGDYVGGGTVYGPETDCAWDGTYWTVAFSDIGLATGVDTLSVSRVTPAGQLVGGGPTVVSSTSQSVREFALASGNGATQIVWNDWSVSGATFTGGDLGDVHGAQVDDTGVASPRVAVSSSPPAQVRPVITGDASAGYLVAFLSLDSGVTRVCVQRLGPAGQPLDLQPTVLRTGSRTIRRLDAAFDGHEWLVVWDDDFGDLRHTWGMRVGLNGAPLDAAPLNLLRGERPSVAAAEGTRTFLLVSWDHNQSNEYIRATRVDGQSGGPLDAPYFTVSGGSGFPDVLGFDDRWLVVWGGIGGAFVDLQGGVGGSFLAASGVSEAVHGLARDGDTALLAFSRHASTSLNADIHARRILKDGTLLDSAQGFPVCQAGNTQFDPRASFDGAHFRLTWTDYQIHPLLVPGLGDVRSATVSPAGDVVELCGTLVAGDARIPEGDAHVAARDGFALVANVELAEAAPYGGLRVAVRTVGTPVVGEAVCFGDGSSVGCPCGNVGGPELGCANSAGGGARLAAAGSPSVAADLLAFEASGLPPGSPGLLFQGMSTLATPLPFGDGLRCVSGPIVRLGVDAADATGGAAWGPGLAQQGQWVGGEQRVLQVWYRNVTGPCGFGFNMSHALEVSLAP